MRYPQRPSWLIRLHGLILRRRVESVYPKPADKTPTGWRGIIQGTPNGALDDRFEADGRN